MLTNKVFLEYMTATLLTILFIITYGGGLYFWNRNNAWRLDNKPTCYVKYLHYFFLLLTLVAVITELIFDLHFRGLWTTRAIIIGLLFTGIFFYPFANKNAENRIEKNYFKLFSFLPVGVAGFLLIPFAGIIITLTIFGRLTNPASKIFYEDDNLRIQSTYVGVLGPSQFDIIEKKGLFEKRHYRSITHDEHFDSLRVQYDADSTRIILKSSNEYIEPVKVITIPN